MKIALDAGHGGVDLGATYQDRFEKDDNLRLALAVGKLLEDAGNEVYYTRTEDTYDSPVERARLVNDAEAGLLISFHRNDSTTPNTYTGAEGFIHSAGGMKARLAERILNDLGDVGFLNLGVNAYSNDVLLKRTQAPAILLEIGFINTEDDNALYDRKFDEIASSIANSISDSIKQLSDTHAQTYRVQVGGFTSELSAQKVAYHLFQDGYEPVIRKLDENLFVIMVGEIFLLDQAVMLEQFLRILGYNTMIVSESN